jgi:hypothetical protein
MNLANKPESNLPKLCLKTLKPILETLLNPKRTLPKQRTFVNQNLCKPKPCLKTVKPILETLPYQKRTLPANGL